MIDKTMFNSLLSETVKQLSKGQDVMLEAINIKDFNPGFEKSQFGGFRAVISYVSNPSRSMYVGGTGWKTKEWATKEAETYLKAYADAGDSYASKMVSAFRRNNASQIFVKN